MLERASRFVSGTADQINGGRGRVAQVLPCDGRLRRFDSDRSPQLEDVPVAQRDEHLRPKQKDTRSSRVWDSPPAHAEVAQQVERVLGKDEVIGSKPIFGTNCIAAQPDDTRRVCSAPALGRRKTMKRPAGWTEWRAHREQTPRREQRVPGSHPFADLAQGRALPS